MNLTPPRAVRRNRVGAVIGGRAKSASTRVKTASRSASDTSRRSWLGLMSIENGLLILAVVAVTAYLLAALIFPERF